MSIEFREEMQKLASVISVAKDEDTILEVSDELQNIFGVSGSQVLLKEFASRYGVSLADAVKRPSVFQQALFFLLGDLGSNIVMGRINKRIWSLAQTAAPTVMSAY
jgi:hypothetical protein